MIRCAVASRHRLLLLLQMLLMLQLMLGFALLRAVGDSSVYDNDSRYPPLRPPVSVVVRIRTRTQSREAVQLA